MDREQLLGRARELAEKVITKISGSYLGLPTGQRRPVLIGDSRTIVFRPTYGIEAVLDVREEDREREVLVKELKRNQDQVLQAPKTHIPSKDGQTFIASEQRFVAARDYDVALGEDYDVLIKSDSFYYSYLIRHQLLSVAAESVMHESIARMMQLADKYQMDPSMKTYLSLQEYLFAGEMKVRIRDLTLTDCLDRKVANKFALHQIYQFLVESDEIAAKKLHNQVLKSDRTSDPYTQYPNTFKRRVDVAATMVCALTASSPDTFDEIVGSYGGNKEMTERARRVVDHIDRLKQHIYRTLLDPASPDFPELKEILEHYLTQDRRTRITALNIVGLKEVTHIYELYRKARSYSQQGTFSDFYTHLAQVAKDYAEEIPDVEGILTENDLFSIIDIETEPAPSVNTPTLEDFSRIIGQIFSKTSATNYAINVEAINWYQIVPPQNVILSFDPNTPKRFSIQFNYQNEEGEYLSLSFNDDLRRNLLGWSFIEEPSETPEFSKFRHSLLFVTQAVLFEAQKQAQIIYDQRQRDKLQASSVSTQIQQKREKVRPEPTMPGRTDVRRGIREQNNQEALTAVELAEIDQVLSPEIKKQLIIPSIEERAKLVRKLSHEDQARAFVELEEYNGTQIGKFLPLKRKGPHGEILWAIDISSRVPGRIRGLATPIEFGDRIVRFVILDIDYRRNIYRNWRV